MESPYALFLDGGQSLGTLGICIISGHVQRHLDVLYPLDWELGLGGKRGKKERKKVTDSSITEITQGTNYPT